MRPRLARLFPIVAALAIVGCAGKKAPIPPPAPAPTRIIATLSASADLNPDPSGRPSPLVFRIYELKTLSTFNNTDFFSLYEKDGTALAPDLVAREEMTIKPGETRQLERTLSEATRHIGLFAVYRDLDQAVWRTSLAIAPHQTTAIKIALQRTAIMTRPLDK